MSKPLQIVGLGGSLSSRSSSLTALKIALNAAEEAGATVELLDVAALNLPMYVPHTQDAPEAARTFCEAVYNAQGMLWSSPLYHGTISGSFKNALDWLELLHEREPSYLTDKVIGLISAAGGSQGLQAINTMEYVVRALRGWAVPLVIPIAQGWSEFDAEGRARHPEVERQLRALGQEVVRAAQLFAAQPMTTPEAAEAEAALQPIAENEEKNA